MRFWFFIVFFSLVNNNWAIDFKYKVVDKSVNNFNVEFDSIKSGLKNHTISLPQTDQKMIVQVTDLAQIDILLIHNAHLDYVRFIAIDSLGGILKDKVTGDKFVYKTRDLDIFTFGFQLPQQTQTVVLEIETKGPMLVPIKLMKYNQIFYYLDKISVAIWLFIGVCFMTILMSIFLFLFFKDPLFKYNIFLAFALAFFVMTEYEFLFRYLWPNFPVINDYNAVMYNAVFVMSLYTYKTFNILDTFPRIKWFYFIHFSIVFISIALNLVGYYQFSLSLIYVNYMFFILLNSFSVFVLLFNKEYDNRNKLYIYGWIGYLLFTVVYYLGLFDVLDFGNFFVNSSLQVGTAVFLIFTTLALINRFKILKEEHEDFHKNLINSLEENQTLIEKHNLELEEKVQQRTNEINLKNKEIEKQNIELIIHKEHLEDIVEERNGELIRINKQLLLKNEKLEQFVYVTAHNLRGPVTTILGGMNLLEGNLEDKSLLKEIHPRIQKTTLRLDQIIKDLLLFLNDEKNEELKQLQKNNLNIQLNKTLELFEDELKTYNVIINNVLPRDIHISSVSVYLESVLYNIISNAIKYKNSERQLIIEITYVDENEFDVIRIKDNGIGIDLKKYGKKIFMMYQQLHNKSNLGQGLGLFIVKTQMESMGGFAEVESELGVGSTFILKFPK